VATLISVLAHLPILFAGGKHRSLGVVIHMLMATVGLNRTSTMQCNCVNKLQHSGWQLIKNQMLPVTAGMLRFSPATESNFHLCKQDSAIGEGLRSYGVDSILFLNKID
jgi:hypothetical protein